MQQDPSLKAELLAEVESITSTLAEHAASSEKLGRLDDPSVEALPSTRLLRFLSLRGLGGLEADPVTQIEILEAVARVDASASWTLGIVAGVSGIGDFPARRFRTATLRQRHSAHGRVRSAQRDGSTGGGWLSSQRALAVWQRHSSG